MTTLTPAEHLALVMAKAQIGRGESRHQHDDGPGDGHRAADGPA